MSDLCTVLNTKPHISTKPTWGIEFFRTVYFLLTSSKKRGLYKIKRKIYNADSLGAFNIMRLYRQNNNLEFDTPIKGLSNPKRKYIPVTDQFFNEDFQNWNGKAGNVGISGRNYPTGYELIELINQSITQMLGNLITE